MSPTQAKVDYRRLGLGVAGTVFFILGCLNWTYPPESESLRFTYSSSFRIGMVLLAMCLAFPQVSQMKLWKFGAIGGSLLLIAVRPKLFLLLLQLLIYLTPFFILFWFLRQIFPPKDSAASNSTQVRKPECGLDEHKKKASH